MTGILKHMHDEMSGGLPDATKDKEEAIKSSEGRMVTKQAWVHDVNHSLVWNEKTKINPLNPKDITSPVIEHIAEEVGERFGRFQDIACRVMKETLVAMKIEGTKILSLSLSLSLQIPWALT